MTQRVRPSSGFAALAALVLLTVLAAMGAYMLSFSNTQQLSLAQDLQGTQAYWAARAGLEWSLGSLRTDASTCPTSPPATVNTGSSFNLSVSCSMNTYLEAGSTVKIFVLGATASRGIAGTLGYVERSMSASVEVP